MQPGSPAHIICSFTLTAGSSPASAALIPQTNGTSEANGLPPSPLEARKRELENILHELQSDGFTARDLSEDELAKSHARYLVGGRAKVEHERIFRFEFPERPGALRKFLEGLQSGFNISLFHYRNHGGGASFKSKGFAS